MVTNKSKKVTKYRGHTTHGGGHRKKRRGAGSRGGRGNAGTGKRAGHKKAGISRKLGNKGFTRRHNNIIKVKAVNVGYFTLAVVEGLVAAGKAVKEGEFYSIDLGKLGFTKLLGTGEPDVKLKITVSHCSARAAEKVKSTGGEVVVSES